MATPAIKREEDKVSSERRELEDAIRELERQLLVVRGLLERAQEPPPQEPTDWGVFDAGEGDGAQER